MKKAKKYCYSILLIISLMTIILPLRAQVIDLESDLILHLPLNGNASDQSGWNVPTMVLGPVLTNDRFGNANSAYLFDGLNDCIRLNDNNPLITAKTFSICMWAKVNGKSLSETQGNNLFEQRDNDSEIPFAQSTIVFNAEQSGNVALRLRSNPSSNGFAYAFACTNDHEKEWHYYAGTLDADGNVMIYIDALPFCSGYFPERGDFVTSVDHVNIGSHHYRGVFKGAFNGVIDEIRIYNRALTACEVEALYNGGSTKER